MEGVNTVDSWEDRHRSETALYRYYDRGGCLLYLGIAANARARMFQHALCAPWFAQAAAVSTEYFTSREDAAAAETAAIGRELPLWNRTGPGGKIVQQLTALWAGAPLNRRGEDGRLTEDARLDLANRVRRRRQFARHLACDWCVSHIVHELGSQDWRAVATEGGAPPGP